MLRRATSMPFMTRSRRVNWPPFHARERALVGRPFTVPDRVLMLSEGFAPRTPLHTLCAPLRRRAPSRGSLAVARSRCRYVFT